MSWEDKIRKVEPYVAGEQPKEKNIIRGHMWPLTLAHPPKSKEAVLVSLADKEIATMEFVKPELSRARKVYRRFKDLASEKK